MSLRIREELALDSFLLCFGQIRKNDFHVSMPRDLAFRLSA